MEFIVKSRNGKVTQREQEYIKEKIGKLERYLDLISKVTVEVGEVRDQPALGERLEGAHAQRPGAEDQARLRAAQLTQHPVHRFQIPPRQAMAHGDANGGRDFIGVGR